MQVKSAIGLRFLHLDRNAVSVSPRILANAGDLPGDSHAGTPAANLELVVGQLLGDIDRSKATNTSELVAEIAVQHAEPVRHLDSCLTVCVQRGHAVIDVLHVRRLDERMVEVLICWIERVIDFERTTCLREVAIDVDIAVEKRRVAAVLLVGKQSVSSGGVVKSSAHAAGALGLTVHAETRCTVVINSRYAGVFASRYSVHAINSDRRYRPIDSITGAGISIHSVRAAT